MDVDLGGDLSVARGADLDDRARLRQACPRCGAAARGEVTWCTQCYLDLRSSAAPAPRSQPTLEPPAASAALTGTATSTTTGRTTGTTTGTVSQDSPPTWPCPCGAANPYDETSCTACGAVFLSRLRSADAPSLVLPVVGDVARFSRTQRLAGACGAALLISLLLALVGLLL